MRRAWSSTAKMSHQAEVLREAAGDGDLVQDSHGRVGVVEHATRSARASRVNSWLCQSQVSPERRRGPTVIATTRKPGRANQLH
jgi:hypothetical protein